MLLLCTQALLVVIVLWRHGCARPAAPAPSFLDMPGKLQDGGASYTEPGSSPVPWSIDREKDISEGSVSTPSSPKKPTRLG